MKLNKILLLKNDCFFIILLQFVFLFIFYYSSCDQKIPEQMLNNAILIVAYIFLILVGAAGLSTSLHKCSFALLSGETWWPHYLLEISRITILDNLGNQWHGALFCWNIEVYGECVQMVMKQYNITVPDQWHVQADLYCIRPLPTRFHGLIHQTTPHSPPVSNQCCPEPR